MTPNLSNFRSNETTTGDEVVNSEIRVDNQWRNLLTNWPRKSMGQKGDWKPPQGKKPRLSSKYRILK